MLELRTKINIKCDACYVTKKYTQRNLYIYQMVYVI